LFIVALSEHSAKSLLLAPGGSSTIAASSSSGPPVSRSEIKPKKAVQFMEKPAEFYDDIYFDSDDEERESSLKQNGTRELPCMKSQAVFAQACIRRYAIHDREI
jgi:hypothetical protein